MNPSFSSDWSREEKEEYATKRMNEMKLKNEKFKQRHAEVEKDRLEAEKQCSAVTSAAKILSKTPESIEEKPMFHREPRKQREWDIGKSTNDGDWYPPAQQDYHSSQEYHDSRTRHNESDRYPPAQQDYHRSQDYQHSRPPRRGGFYDKRKERQDGAWRSRGYGHRGGSRYRGSNQSRSTAFQSGNVPNYSRESSKNSFKASTDSFKTSSNWNDSKRNAYYSGNTYPKLAVKSDSDKMWHDDGLNEVQNKQSRVEKWVKSINKVEDWSEGDDKPCNNYKNVGTGRHSGNYQDKEQKGWDNEGHVDQSTKKHFTQNKAKYEKHYEHSFSKNVSTYGDKSPTSNLDVGKKTNSYGHKRDNKGKYNHGTSSYDKTEVSNFKNDPKIKKQSRYNKNQVSGADIWDDEYIDESNNKFSDSKTEFEESKFGHPNKNRNSRSDVWDYKETDLSYSKTRSEVKKKEYRRNEVESDIWNDCDQTSNWGNKCDTKSDTGIKEQNNDEGKNVTWDYNQGDDWNNKVTDSEIESNVKTLNSCKITGSESAGWDNEKNDVLNEDPKAKQTAYCDKGNDFKNVLAENEVFTFEKSDENKEYDYANVCDDSKEMGVLTDRLNNLEEDSEHSTSEYQTNDSKEISVVKLDSVANENICNESQNSEFFISKDDCNYESKNFDFAEQKFKISECSDNELNDSKSEDEVQKYYCKIDNNEHGVNILENKNLDLMKENKDLKCELKMRKQVSNDETSTSITENSPSLKTELLHDSQIETSIDSSSTTNQSVSHKSNKTSQESNDCIEMDKKVVLKDESNLSCVTNEFCTLNSNNSVIITHSKPNESDELLQQSICNVEKKNSLVFSENQDKTVPSEISSENIACDINKSSPSLSQGSIQDDNLSSHTDVEVTESTKSISDGALNIPDKTLPVDTNESNAKVHDI